jgi:hypothetical protein
MFDRITTSPVAGKSKWQLILTIAAVWQLVVYALSVGGIFGTIYEWLGIPWNTTGIRNFIGTTVGLVLLQLPLIVLVG